MFSYPHPGFWAIHFFGIALIFALGKANAQENGRILQVNGRRY